MGALAHQLDQVVVAQHRAVQDQRAGDIGLVLGELQHQLARRVGQRAQSLGEAGAHFALHVVDEAVDDAEHQPPLLVAQPRFGVEEEIGRGVKQTVVLGLGAASRLFQQGERLVSDRIGHRRMARGIRIAHSQGETEWAAVTSRIDRKHAIVPLAC
ncbi:hypothetical protein [Desertibaculum subflavum]|uniref:hypothetical protein n=1 Tax=Desertibaculum subflavum TaxID=2268458 RepID=UPI0013C509DB